MTFGFKADIFGGDILGVSSITVYFTIPWLDYKRDIIELENKTGRE